MQLKCKLAVAAGVLALGGAGGGAALISTASAAAHVPARAAPAQITRAAVPAAPAVLPAAVSAQTPSPDTAAAENAPENENAVESEAGQPGQPAAGHQDPPGTVNHECTGDCVE